MEARTRDAALKQILLNSCALAGLGDATDDARARLSGAGASFDDRAIDTDDLLRQKTLVEVFDRRATVDALASSEHAFERVGDCLGSIVGAKLAALDAF